MEIRKVAVVILAVLHRWKQRKRIMNAVLALYARYYSFRFFQKEPEKTSVLQGNQRIAEWMDGNERRFLRIARMSKEGFILLCKFFRESNLLQDTRRGVLVESNEYYKAFSWVTVTGGLIIFSLFIELACFSTTL
jgi:hypothetical protein